MYQRLIPSLRSHPWGEEDLLEATELDRALTIPSYERGVARLLRYDRHP